MNTSIIESARATILSQAASLTQLATQIDLSFEKAMHLIQKGKGRLVVSGIGKSAIVAQKIVATLNSTGTNAAYMHAGDAIHGDLGMIQMEDIVLLISKSGESPEIKALIPFIKSFGNTLIGMVGNLNSYLAIQSDIVLDASVHQESCPNNLAPTNSTTAQMVMGDAMAVALMQLNNFKEEDFAKFHPGGNLGKRLYLQVKDLYINNQSPKVLLHATIKEVIVEITEKRLGVTVVTDDQNKVVGIITDGDLRRMLEKNDTIKTITAKDILTENPKMIPPDMMATEALGIFRKFDISQLIVANSSQYLGILHIHDLVQAGII